MTNEKYNLIFTVVEALEANARLDFGDDSKYVKYAMQIRDLLRVKPKTPDYSRLFEDDDVATDVPETVITHEPIIDVDMRGYDPSKPPAKTSIRANDCKAIDTNRKFVHTASMLEDERFGPRQRRVIAQRIVNDPTYAKLDGYLVLCTKEKTRIQSYKHQIKSCHMLMKAETELCTLDEIADIDLHFECTKISLQRRGFWFDNHEHTFIAQYLWNKHLFHDSSDWASLKRAEKQAIVRKAALLKQGKLNPIDPKLVNAERICWRFDLDWNKIKEGL